MQTTGGDPLGTIRLGLSRDNATTVEAHVFDTGDVYVYFERNGKCVHKIMQNHWYFES